MLLNKLFPWDPETLYKDCIILLLYSLQACATDLYGTARQLKLVLYFINCTNQ